MELGRDPGDKAWVLTVRTNFKNAEFKIYRKHMWKDSLNLMEMYLPPSTSMPALTPVLSKPQNIPYPNSKVKQAPPPPPNPAALNEKRTKEETHVDKVFRKHSVQEVGDTCKPLKMDEKIPNHTLKCYAQLAISRTFSDIVGTHWQDHTWYFGADWIIKRWIEPKEGFTHEDVEVSHSQEEHPDGGTTGGSGGLGWSEELHPTQGTKGSTWLIVKWIANGTRMTTVTAGTGEHATTAGRGGRSNTPATTEWVVTLMMVRVLLTLTMVRALLACVLTCMQSSKLEQQLICGGKTFDEGQFEGGNPGARSDQ